MVTLLIVLVFLCLPENDRSSLELVLLNYIFLIKFAAAPPGRGDNTNPFVSLDLCGDASETVFWIWSLEIIQIK